MEKIVSLIFLMSVYANAAEFCDIKDKKTNAVVHTYPGACNQGAWSGEWGMPELSVHVPNTTKQKENDDAKAAADAKQKLRDNRAARIQAACRARGDVLLTDICDAILDK